MSRRLAARVKKQQKMMKVVNAAKAAEQLQRRTGLFRKAEEALEEQRAATLKHLVPPITIIHLVNCLLDGFAADYHPPH